MTMHGAVDDLDTLQYTTTEVINADPLDILRVWTITVRTALTDSNINTVDAEVKLSHDVSAAYESNLDTDGGREVELCEVPEPIRAKLANRLERDADVIREGTELAALNEDVGGEGGE